MQLVIALGVGVLHCHLGTKLDVLAHRLAERGIGGHPSRIERRQIELDEPLPLRLRDPQAAMNSDQVGEAQLA